jgi:hypothetical protein
MKEKVDSSAKYKTALIKKALGYDATEVVEEYVSDDLGEVKLTKKKVTKKNVPPDLTALKMLIDQTETAVSEMTDEQLEEEKQKLLQLLGELNEKEKKIANKKTKK